MMKNISFTAEEAEWLTKLLLQRISLYVDIPKVKPTIIDHCISAILKLEEKLTVKLKDWERTVCASVINEDLPTYEKQINVTDAFSLVCMTADQRTMLYYIDMGKTILKKIHKPKQEALPDYNFNSLYRNQYELLSKLKSCDLIYISKTDGNNVYKIGFVYKGIEASVYELSQQINPGDLAFYTLNMDAIQYGRRSFSMVTDRSEAFNLLSRCDDHKYPANQLTFFKQLLK
jgi:hypothetical protein